MVTTNIKLLYFQAADSECDEPPNIGGTTGKKSLLLYLLLISVTGSEARVLETDPHHPDSVFPRHLVPDQDIYTPGKHFYPFPNIIRIFLLPKYQSMKLSYAKSSGRLFYKRAGYKAFRTSSFIRNGPKQYSKQQET